jgi:hypothetical protein
LIIFGKNRPLNKKNLFKNHIFLITVVSCYSSKTVFNFKKNEMERVLNQFQLQLMFVTEVQEIHMIFIQNAIIGG